MKQTPVLVCCDAGAVGRVLLARGDLHLRWALTLEEARAAVRSGFPRVVLTREKVAAGVLEEMRAAHSSAASIVLLEPDGWTRYDGYFAKGATVLVRASNGGRILEAISELTGLAFSAYPRVPFETVLDVVAGGEHVFLQSLDLSASGVSVRGLPHAEIGLPVEIGFSMLDPPISARGIVVRTGHHGGEPIAGVCLSEMDTEMRAQLSALVDHEISLLPPMRDSLGLSGDVEGEFTRDLCEALEHDANAIVVYRNMLRESLAESQATVLPSWLRRLSQSLTEVERRAIVERSGPSWASSAVDLRISLRRQRLELADHVSSLELDAELVAEFCRHLAAETRDAPAALVNDVLELRAALLREVHGAPSKQRIGLTSAHAGVPQAETFDFVTSAA